MSLKIITLFRLQHTSSLLIGGWICDRCCGCRCRRWIELFRKLYAVDGWVFLFELFENLKILHDAAMYVRAVHPHPPVERRPTTVGWVYMGQIFVVTSSVFLCVNCGILRLSSYPIEHWWIVLIEWIVDYRSSTGWLYQIDCRTVLTDALFAYLGLRMIY